MVDAKKGTEGFTPMSELNCVSEPIQVQLTEEAMTQASAVVACLAERLADDIERFVVPDGTGEATLRMFAAMIRSLNMSDVPEPASPRNTDHKATKRATSRPKAAMLH